MGMTELIARIRDLRELQALIEEAQGEAEAIRNELKAYMGDAEELRAGEYLMTWKPVTSSRIDTRALREALPDVAREYTSTSFDNELDFLIGSVSMIISSDTSMSSRLYFQ